MAQIQLYKFSPMYSLLWAVIVAFLSLMKIMRVEIDDDRTQISLNTRNNFWIRQVLCSRHTWLSKFCVQEMVTDKAARYKYNVRILLICKILSSIIHMEFLNNYVSSFQLSVRGKNIPCIGYWWHCTYQQLNQVLKRKQQHLNICPMAKDGGEL